MGACFMLWLNIHLQRPGLLNNQQIIYIKQEVDAV